MSAGGGLGSKSLKGEIVVCFECTKAFSKINWAPPAGVLVDGVRETASREVVFVYGDNSYR